MTTRPRVPGPHSADPDLPCLPKNASMRSGGGESLSPQEESDMGHRSAAAQRAELAVLADMRRELVALGDLTVGELAEKYRAVFGIPTRTRNKEYLRKHIAWRIQEQAQGGLSRRALERIEVLAPQAPARWRERVAAKQDEGGPGEPGITPTQDPRLPPIGTVLTRIHDGIEYRVAILADGFEYQGKCYRSLSQVARCITGTSWNGFTFFFGRGSARGGTKDGTR